MEELLNHLNEYLETHTGKTDEETGIEWLYLDGPDEAGDKLETELWEKLIIGSWFNIATQSFLMESGYHVFPGEQDSFGLLSVCIDKDNRRICFG